MQRSKLTSCFCVKGKFGFCGRAVSYPALLEYYSCIPCMNLGYLEAHQYHIIKEGTFHEVQEVCMVWRCLG